MSRESDNILIADLVADLDREREVTLGLVRDLAAVRLVLSEALTQLQATTTKLERQNDTIRRLIGLVETGEGRHSRIALVNTPDVELPEGTVLASDIQWKPDGGG